MVVALISTQLSVQFSELSVQFSAFLSINFLFMITLLEKFYIVDVNYKESFSYIFLSHLAAN